MENTTDDNIRCIDAIRVLHENVFIHGYAKHKNKLDRGSMSRFRRVCPASTILGEISIGKMHFSIQKLVITLLILYPDPTT